MKNANGLVPALCGVDILQWIDIGKGERNDRKVEEQLEQEQLVVVDDAGRQNFQKAVVVVGVSTRAVTGLSTRRVGGIQGMLPLVHRRPVQTDFGDIVPYGMA